MYTLTLWLPRGLVLALAAVLAVYGSIWLPICLVTLVAWGRGFPRLP